MKRLIKAYRKHRVLRKFDSYVGLWIHGIEYGYFTKADWPRMDVKLTELSNKYKALTN